MSERRLWQYIRNGLRGTGIMLQRHEDRYSNDIADVSFSVRDTNGWVELKHAKNPPRDRDKHVKFGHPLTKGQAIWLLRRPNTYILAQIGAQYLLFHGHRALMVYNGGPLHELETLATQVWVRKIEFDNLFTALRG